MTRYHRICNRMLEHLGHIALPAHPSGGFDHADVNRKMGRLLLSLTGGDNPIVGAAPYITLTNIQVESESE